MICRETGRGEALTKGKHLMSRQWRSYLTKVNDELASIRVDLALATEVPMPSKPWLFWVWVYFQSPRPDGLSSKEEAPSLWDIEDVLEANLVNFASDVYCGCVTTSGRREFYFYGTHPAHLDEASGKLLEAFPSYKFDVGSHRDERWSQYLNVLYPSEDQLDSIRNADVLEVMLKNGDHHDAYREVTHWLYFSSQHTSDQFIATALTHGFTNARPLVPSKAQEEQARFGVTLTTFQSVVPSAIDGTTRSLRALAAQSAGEYDGWEAQVVQR